MMPRRVPFAEGFLTDTSRPLEEVRLKGVRCKSCGVVLFGTRRACENCGGRELEELALSTRGKIWSFTIQRYPPPPPFKLGSTKREEWKPRTIAWIDLPEGARILGIVDCKPEEARIGMEVELVIEKGWEDEAGNEVLIYKFKPVM